MRPVRLLLLRALLPLLLQHPPAAAAAPPTPLLRANAIAAGGGGGVRGPVCRTGHAWYLGRDRVTFAPRELPARWFEHPDAASTDGRYGAAVYAVPEGRKTEIGGAASGPPGRIAAEIQRHRGW